MIRIAWYAAVALFTLTILILLWQFSAAVVMFALSLSISAAMRPVVDALAKKGLNRNIGLAISSFLLVVLMVGLLYYVGDAVIRNIQVGVDQLLVIYERFVRADPSSSSNLLGGLSSRLPSTEILYEIITEEQVTLVAGSVFGFAEGAAQTISRIVIILVLSIYWSADQVRFERLWLSLLPVNYRSRSREIWRAIEEGVGAYTRRQVVESLLAGVILWLGYQLMGLELAAFLAVLAALLLLIPWLGIVLAIIPAFLLGLSNGLLGGIGAAIFTAVVLLLIDVVIMPRLFTHQRPSSLLLVILIVALGNSYGFIGAILAPPLAVSLQILLGGLFQNYIPLTSGETEVEIKNLEQRLSEIKTSLTERPEPLQSEVISLADRLEQLIGKTHEYIRTYKHS